MDWADKIAKVEGDFGPTDVKALQVVFGGRPFQRALREVLREADDAAKQLASADLVTDEGRLKAIRNQGRIDGIRRAVDLLIELTAREFEEDEND